MEIFSAEKSKGGKTKSEQQHRKEKADNDMGISNFYNIRSPYIFKEADYILKIELCASQKRHISRPRKREQSEADGGGGGGREAVLKPDETDIQVKSIQGGVILIFSLWGGGGTQL